MVLDLREIFASKVKSMPVEVRIDMSDYSNGFVCPISEPVSFTGTVSQSAEIVTLEGTAHVVYSAPCDLCATPVTRQFDYDFSHVIVDSLSNENDDEYIVAVNMTIDLDELIRSDVILELPTRFLCREDCKGICPGCGKMLNFEQCVCKKETDPRLAKLDDFFK